MQSPQNSSRCGKSSVRLPFINQSTASSINFENDEITQQNAVLDLSKFADKASHALESITSGQKSSVQINDLKNELIKIIVNTLMVNTDDAWQNLSSCFQQIQPMIEEFESDRRLYHYLERIYFYSCRAVYRKSCSDLLDLVSSMFPEQMQSIRSSGTPRSFVSSSVEKIEKRPVQLVPDANINFYEGKIDPYKNKIKQVSFKPMENPTVKEISETLPLIAYQSFKLESNWTNKSSNLALATSLNLDSLNEEYSHSKKTPSKKELFKNYDKDKEPETFELNHLNKLFGRDAPDFEEKCLNLTGREMVFYLIKSTHLGQAISFYLNRVESRHFRPYDLINVPASKVNPAEYYIFSVFGVLQILGGEENEKLSLDEWNKHAMLWEACSKIKFFRQFLWRKFLVRWRRNAKFSRFIKLRKAISSEILLAIPSYGEAMVQISKLVGEILGIKFLPVEAVENIYESSTVKAVDARIGAKRQNSFTVDGFLKRVGEMNQRSEELLDYFFVYVRYVLNHTRQKLYDKLKFYEILVNQIHPREVAKSMSQQQKIMQERKNELAKLNKHIGMIGNFLCLVNMFVRSNLLLIARAETRFFTSQLLKCNESEREPIFLGELNFNKEEKMAMSPSKEVFIEEITYAIQSIGRCMIKSSEIIDLQGMLRDIEKYGFQVIEYKLSEDDEDLSHKELKEKNIHAFYEHIVKQNRTDLPIKKPIVNTRKDYDESLLDKKLVLKFEEKILKVNTYMLKASSNPIEITPIEKFLRNDQELLKLHVQVFEQLDEAAREIDVYCAENTWVNEIKLYVSKWSPKLVAEWKRIGAFEIDDQLNKIKNWIESVRSNIEKTIITKNRILKIDSTPIERFLVPNLERIFGEICECVVKEMSKEVTSFIELMKVVMSELTEKPKTIEEFAYYAKKVIRHKDNMSEYETQMNMIKALTDVVRINYRALQPDEEQLDQQAQELWKSFMFSIQEVVEFVNTQSPNILEQLDTLYQKYVQEIQRIHKTGTTGVFLDPLQDSSKILEEIKELCYDFEAVQKILLQCISWRESITEKIEDISFVDKLSEELNARKDLWKYYDVTYHHIKDWKNTYIKKINVKSIYEKLNFWDQKAQEITEIISKEDQVWLSWKNLLSSFRGHMKWIERLASESFKTEQFQELFNSIGLVYDPNKEYTVQNLMDLKLDLYADLIALIHKNSNNEMSQCQLLNSIRDMWNYKLKFKLAKNFPMKLYKTSNFDLHVTASHAISSKLPRSTQIKEMKELADQQSMEQSKLMKNASYKLIDIDEIRYFAEDSIIKLDMIAQSRITKKTIDDCLEFKLRIAQILKLTETWFELQHKWLFLDRVYAETEVNARPSQSYVEYKQASDEFKDFQIKLNIDPVVMSILKDESYPIKLEEWLKKMNRLCSEFDAQLEQYCVEFPRFYFIERNKLIQLLSHTRDCRKYLEGVKMCLPGVDDMVYSLPANLNKTIGSSDSNNLNSFDLDIYANDLQVVGLYGCNKKDKLKFFMPLQSHSGQRVSQWFDHLLKIVKSSMSNHIQRYLEKLSIYMDHSVLPTIEKRLNAIKDLPIQTVLLGEIVLWCDAVSAIIEAKKYENFKHIMSYLNNSISQLSSLQINEPESTNKELFARLILIMIYKRDLTVSLINMKDGLNELSYEWLSVLKYKYQKNMMLKASETYDSNKPVQMKDKYENFQVIQMNTRILYDFEYNDLSTRLAISPLTERCFLNFTHALSSYKCVGILGPNMSGKKETISLLAQACGQHLKEINCNQNMSVDLANIYLKGLVSSGSWVLFNKIEQLETNALSTIGHQLNFIRNSIKSLMSQSHGENKIAARRDLKQPQRPSTGQDVNTKTNRVSTVPFFFATPGLKTYFEDLFTEEQPKLLDNTKIPVKGSELKIRGEQLKNLENVMMNGISPPDMYYQRKYLGLIRFQNGIVKISVNYGCFVTGYSFQKLPDNLKNELRACQLAEPDLKTMTAALLTSYGLNQGLTHVDTLAKKIVEFLNQISLIIPNEFARNCRNLNVISKVVELSSLKYKADKGRQERAICMMLACIFAPCITDQNEKALFNSALKEIFEFEATSFIEEILSNVIKEQLNDDGLRVNNKQIQRMIDLYTGSRINQFVILSGAPLEGKTTIWKTISRAMNNLQFKENTAMSKTTEVFKKYSFLVNFLPKDEKFAKILTFHLFPNVYNNLKSSVEHSGAHNLLTQIITSCEQFHYSIQSLQKEHDVNKKILFSTIEKWIVLDSEANDSLSLDQLTILRNQSNLDPAYTSRIPDTIKFIIETPTLRNLSPSLVNRALLIVQQDLDYKHVLETKLAEICFNYNVPQSKVSLLQEYSVRYFNDLHSTLDSLNYKSSLHNRTQLNKINFNNFIYSYAILVDCLMKRFDEQLKQASEDEISNWKALKSISSYAFFWSIASYLTTDDDLDNFNEVATGIISKQKTELNPPNLKLYQSDINILENCLIPFERPELDPKAAKVTILPQYQYQAYLVKLCIENSTPCMIYGDVGIGKTSFIEKLLANKYDHIKLHNIEPEQYVYTNIVKQTRFYQNKKYNSFNGYKHNYLYFIDDLNLSYSCGKAADNRLDASSSESSNMELIRQIMETRKIYSDEENSFIDLNNINFILTSTYPEISDNYVSLSQRTTKHFLNVHIGSDRMSLAESIFLMPIRNWLEEFPHDSIRYPNEMAQALIRSLVDIYESVKLNLKPVPKSPQYLFSFNDVAKVMQGLQLLASKARVVKVNKKNKEAMHDASVNQVATIIKLFCHEVMRVFGDRVTDDSDESLLRTTIITTVVNNFCTSSETEYDRLNEQFENYSPTRNVEDSHTMSKSSFTENLAHMSHSYGVTTTSDASKLKKTVTFKTGLTDQRGYIAYRGALINRDQLGIHNEQEFLNSIFSKYIIKNPGGKKEKGSDKHNYIEGSFVELLNSATASLDKYEREMSLRMNFFFHNKALQHLARLTRIVSMSRGHAILFSEQCGLGRTSLVRFCAYLCRMKYYEPKVTSNEAKNEVYLKSMLRQACMMSGIKGSWSIIYVKAEHFSHHVLENLFSFVKTGIYPGLFSEKEIWCIANEISPFISSTKRVEGTLSIYNTFLNSILDRVHVVISPSSGLNSVDLANLMRRHSLLYSNFYIDHFERFTPDVLNSIAHYYLVLQIEENRSRRLNMNKKFNTIDEENTTRASNQAPAAVEADPINEEVSLNSKEIQVFSSLMVDLHQIAYEQYTSLFVKMKQALRRGEKTNSSFISLPKPFTVTMFKQIALFFHIYMKRLRDQELIRIDKFQNVFKKLDQVTYRLENFELIKEEWQNKLSEYEKLLEICNDKIDKQKERYRQAVADCKKEEKLIEEMTMALEKLKHDVNNESHELKNLYTPQFDIALAALKSLSKQSFVELRSFREPPQIVMAVINTLCLMFRQPPGWESGKLLLIRENFFDDLIYYDKKNMPDDIFEALEQICQVETFTPEYVKKGSLAASALCEWILSVHRFASYERKVCGRTNEMKGFEEIYNKRLEELGNKRSFSEKMCTELEELCKSRVNVLRDIKRLQSDLEDLEKNRDNVKHLANLLENDKKTWQNQFNKSISLVKSYKPDALLTACFVCYAGIFDSDDREIISKKWTAAINKLTKLHGRSLSLSIGDSENSSYISKYSLRENFNIKDILFNIANESKDLVLYLNKLSMKDDHFITNALILRELCSVPAKFNSWLLIYDPENITLGLISALQESIDQVKMSLNSEYLLEMTPQSSLKTSHSNVNTAVSTKPFNHKPNRRSLVAIANRNILNRSSVSSLNELFSPNRAEEVDSSLDANVEDRAESLPPLSSFSPRGVGGAQTAGRYSRISSSIWEASTFYSRAQTTATMVYHTRSGNKLFLKSLSVDNESEIHLPIIETDVNIMPKNNLCVLDSGDPELDYKLINAAVHGLAVLLTNSERFSQTKNKLVELLLERDFLVDVNQNKEYIKIGGEEIIIDPGFRLIMHVSTPIHLNHGTKNNHLFNRLNTQLNAAHFVIDFGFSSEYIKRDCMTTIMEREKPGYRNQMHLADKISFDAEYNIINRQEEITERFNATDKMLFEDKDLITYAAAKNNKLNEFQDAHSESIHINKMLNATQRDYTELCDTIGCLFKALKMLYLIYPSYYVTWNQIKRLIKFELDRFLFDKEFIGQARAKQVQTFCIQLIYHYLASSMKKRHFVLLLFLHFICLEKKKNANREFERVYSLFQHALENNETQVLTESLSENPGPGYISSNSWMNCLKLEKMAYKNLSRSLVDGAAKWIEYFQLDKSENSRTELSEKEIDLLNDNPLGSTLNIIDKLVIWFCVRPEKTFEILSKFNVYNFGGLVPSRTEFNVKTAYEISYPHIPILVNLPSNENVFVNTILEINKLSAEKNIKLIIVSISQNISSEVKKLVSTIREAARNGNWILLNNVHLITDWPKELISLIYEIRDSCRTQEEYNIWDDHKLNIPEGKDDDSSSLRDDSQLVSEDFRIWFVAESDHIANVPESLIYDSVKLVPQVSDFKQTYLSCKQSTQGLVDERTCEEASLLHTLMINNNFRRDGSWRLQHLHDFIKIAASFKSQISSENGLTTIHQSILNDVIYGSKLADVIDVTFAKKLIHQVVVDKKYDSAKFIEHSDRFYSISENMNQSKQLYDELKFFFDVYSESKNGQEASNEQSSFDFTMQFKANLYKSIETIKSKTNDVSQTLAKFQQEHCKSYNLSVLYTELLSYNSFLERIKQVSIDLYDSIEGEKPINEKVAKFYHLINNYHTECPMRKGYFTILDGLSQKLSNFVEFASHVIESASSNAELTFNYVSIDSDMLFNSHGVLKKLLLDKKTKLALLKDKETKPSEPIDIVNIPAPLKDNTSQKLNFLLQVGESTTSSFDLIIQNVYVHNAYFDMMSKSFQSTSKKMKNKISSILLTPLLDEKSKSGDVYKCVPFIDNETNQIICNVYIKYWHNKQTSLSNTNATGSEMNADIKSQLGRDDDSQSSDSSNSQNTTKMKPYTPIPLFSPIYFCIYNFNRDFIRKFDHQMAEYC